MNLDNHLLSSSFIEFDPNQKKTTFTILQNDNDNDIIYVLSKKTLNKTDSQLSNLPLYTIDHGNVVPELFTWITKNSHSPLIYQVSNSIKTRTFDLEKKSLQTFYNESLENSYILSTAAITEYAQLLKAIIQKQDFIAICWQFFVYTIVTYQEICRSKSNTKAIEFNEIEQSIINNLDIKNNIPSILQYNNMDWFHENILPKLQTTNFVIYDDNAKKSFEAILKLIQSTTDDHEKFSLKEIWEHMQNLNASFGKHVDYTLEQNEKIYSILNTLFSKLIIEITQLNKTNSKIDYKLLNNWKNYIQKNISTLSKNFQDVFCMQFPYNLPEMFITDDRLEDSHSSNQAKLEIHTENLAFQIMSLLGIDEKSKVTCLDKLTTLQKNNLTTDSSNQAQSLRRQILQIYWQVWKKAYTYAQANKEQTPSYVNWLINYGVFDDRLITKQHLEQLQKLPQIAVISQNDHDSSQANDFLLDIGEWLQKIHDKTEINSWNSDGRSLIDIINLEVAKRKRYKSIDQVPAHLVLPETCIDFEIESFIQEVASLVSGKIQFSFPIFYSEGLGANLHNHLVDKKKIKTILDKITEIDFSVFYRSIVYHNQKMKISTEFVQKKIEPYFILLPASGTKSILWQELSSTNKSSQGRIAVPRFCRSNLNNMILEVLGAYRWEITRAIMGADWNNIAYPSLTSLYTDYVLFVKKNNKLSEQAKEKAKAEFKKFRTDRDRFVNDYLQWIPHESKGIPKLNKVAREIFYHHVPFSASVRSKLKNHPLYSNLDNRYTNLRLKKYQQLKIQYKKSRPLPPELENNLKFYTL